MVLAAWLTSAALAGQAGQIQFIVAASDSKGVPVSDLQPAEIVMTENGQLASVLKVEPYPIPVKLTVAIDNGNFSTDLLAHYRTGLTRMLEALPSDLEMTLITIAPQPLMVVKPTTDRAKIRRGITSFATEEARPRFTDAIVEYSKRLEDEVKFRNEASYLPVLVIISTTANESASYEVSEIQKALSFLVARRTRVIVTMMSMSTGNVVVDINNNRQSLIAIPLTKLTGGRYEALSVSNRLTTLLPEIGREIAALHSKHANQMRVTVRRPEGLTGPIQNPNVYLTRRGVGGSVSVDGFPPMVKSERPEPPRETPQPSPK